MAIQHKPELVAALKTGIEWLQSEQPPDALLSHLGIYLQDQSAKPLQIAYVSLTADSYAGWPVLVFETAYGEDWNIGRPFQYQFTEEDLVALADMVTEAGGIIRTHWNGLGCATVSLALSNPVSPSVLKAVDNMRARDMYTRIENNSIIRPANWR